MLKRQLIIPLIALTFFSLIVSAQEESGCGTLQEGYKCVAGDKGVTVYNPDDLTEIFGVVPREDEGALFIRYKDGRNRQHDFGYLAGHIIKEAERAITVRKYDGQPRQWMAYYWLESDSLKKIKAVQFGLNATEREQGRFVFSLATDAAFLIDEDIERETILDSRAIATRSNGASVVMTPTELYFDIKDGVIVYNNNANDESNDLVLFMRGKEPKELYAYIENLYTLRLAQADPDVDFQEIKVTAMPVAARFGSAFGDTRLSSQEDVGLARGPIRKSGSGNQIAIEGALDTVSMKGGDVLFKDNIVLAPGSEGSIRVSTEAPPATPLFELREGAAAIFSERAKYSDCNTWLEDSACILLNPLERLEINPRGTLDVPFKLTLNDPASNGYNDIYFRKFSREEGSEATLTKGQNSLTFAYNLAEIEPVGDWFNFGVSFSTEPIIYTDTEVSPPRNIYYRFECELDTQKCFFVNPLNPAERSEVLSFTERKPIQCRQDSDCGQGESCSNYRCRTPVTCDALMGSGSIDLLFISEGYEDYELFKQDVRKVLSDGSFRGLYTISPFDEFDEKFRIWTIKGGRVIGRLDSLDVANSYGREYEGKCSSDINIILSKDQIIRAHADIIRLQIVVSMVTLNRNGNALEFVHEMGHAFGKLFDEYLDPISPDDPLVLSRSPNFGHTGFPNCIPEAAAAHPKWRELVPPGDEWQGCGGDCNSETDECERLWRYFRQDENSIMNDYQTSSVFNAVSKFHLREVAKGMGSTVAIWGPMERWTEPPREIRGRE